MRQSIKFAQKSIATKPTIVDMIKAYTVRSSNLIQILQISCKID